MSGFLYKVFPFLRWGPSLDRATVRADLLAGLTGAAVVLPQGVAFATLAGLPPEYGLYCAMVPAVVAALFGSSWHLVSGPTNAISLVVFATISPLAIPGTPDYISLVLTLTFLTGVFQLAMGLARFGTLVNFISHTVVVGFTTGAAILIATSQLKNFFGVPMPSSAVFVETIANFAAGIGSVNPYATGVGVATLVCAIAAKRLAPKLPYMIIAMVAGTLVAQALEWAFGATATAIKTVGALPSSLPALSVPNLSPDALRQIAPIALAVTMLAITEALSIARSIAMKSEQRIDGNQEFIGQGLSNLLGSFFSAYASSGSFNRSGLNYEVGAKTPLAAASSALFLVAILFLVAPLAAYLPIASMAAVLFIVAHSLIETHHIAAIVRNSRSETTVLVVTFLATLFMQLEFAIYTGVILSLMLFLDRNSRPAIYSIVPDRNDPLRKFISVDLEHPECPQLKFVRIDGPLFFGSVDHVADELLGLCGRHENRTRLVIVGKGINSIDIAGAELLVAEAVRRRKEGGELYLYSMRWPVLDLLRHGGYMDVIGEKNVFNSKGTAIERIYPLLNLDICRDCKARAFRECGSRIPGDAPAVEPTSR